MNHIIEGYLKQAKPLPEGLRWKVNVDGKYSHVEILIVQSEKSVAQLFEDLPFDATSRDFNNQVDEIVAKLVKPVHPSLITKRASPLPQLPEGFTWATVIGANGVTFRLDYKGRPVAQRTEHPRFDTSDPEFVAWTQAAVEHVLLNQPKPARPSFDTYYMNMAKVAATRATCDRKHVGAVIVVNNAVVSTGYNGAPRGIPHCDSKGHELVGFDDGKGGRKDSCIRTVHAEMNAIAQAARRGVALEGGTLYTTASCCYDCAKLIINAGIVRVVALEPYASRYGKSGNVDELFAQAGVKSEVMS